MIQTNILYINTRAKGSEMKVEVQSILALITALFQPFLE